MALFGRDHLPTRSTLSHFLAALDQGTVETLQTLFLNDLLARPMGKEEHPDGLCIAKEIASSSLTLMAYAGPPANQPCQKQRIDLRYRGVCVLCILLGTLDTSEEKSCKRVPRSCRSIPINGLLSLTILAMGSTGQNCAREWRRSNVTSKAHHHPEARALLRLDGQYGTRAILADLAALVYIMRGKDYQILKQAEVQASLDLPLDQ